MGYDTQLPTTIRNLRSTPKDLHCLTEEEISNIIENRLNSTYSSSLIERGGENYDYNCNNVHRAYLTGWRT